MIHALNSILAWILVIGTWAFLAVGIWTVCFKKRVARTKPKPRKTIIVLTAGMHDVLSFAYRNQELAPHNGCDQIAPARTMSTNVPGTSTVTIIDCPRCDHRQCAKCTQPIAHTAIARI